MGWSWVDALWSFWISDYLEIPTPQEIPGWTAFETAFTALSSYPRQNPCVT